MIIDAGPVNEAIGRQMAIGEQMSIGGQLNQEIGIDGQLNQVIGEQFTLQSGGYEQISPDQQQQQQQSFYASWSANQCKLSFRILSQQTFHPQLNPKHIFSFKEIMINSYTFQQTCQTTTFLPIGHSYQELLRQFPVSNY